MRHTKAILSIVSLAMIFLVFVPVVLFPGSQHQQGYATYSHTCSGQTCSQILYLKNGTTVYVLSTSIINVTEYESLSYFLFCFGGLYATGVNVYWLEDTCSSSA